ncbi:MAG: hypothetical protein M4D80_12225 [Myxococcota bacterium]|nr:hypothetical protein [Deltaproteobacteria bacterium]MDQ3335927.1 hypothetical protein [Myxococcota bacterium]
MWLVRASLVLVACSSTPKEPTITKEQQTGMCKPAIDRLGALIGGGDAPLAQQIRGALMDRCMNDKWGLDATDCFTKLPTIDKAADCAKYLTVPQRDGFQQAVEGTAR